MKPNVVLFAVLASVVLLAASSASAQTAKVLFYESGKVSKNYKIDSDFSMFKPYCFFAKFLNHVHRMTANNHGLFLTSEMIHSLNALALKGYVAHR